MFANARMQVGSDPSVAYGQSQLGYYYSYDSYWGTTCPLLHPTHPSCPVSPLMLTVACMAAVVAACVSVACVPCRPNEAGSEEDCLVANVWKPSNASKGDKLPVLCFIYGGSWQFGETEPYNGSAIAQKHRVIYVSLAYRTG